MKKLRAKLRTPLPESDMIRIVKRNLRPELSHIIYSMKTYTIDQLRDECKELEKDYLRKDKYSLPQARPSQPTRRLYPVNEVFLETTTENPIDNDLMVVEEIKHKKGSENVVADTLSRIVEEILMPEDVVGFETVEFESEDYLELIKITFTKLHKELRNLWKRLVNNNNKMPPPRPRSIGAPNPNTPMSERQQMALLIQMTASSVTDNSRSSQKSKEHKKEEDFEESHITEKPETKEKPEELNSENKKDTNIDIINTSEASSSNVMKRNFSDLDEEECEDADEVKKKKRKETEVLKDIKQTGNQRIPNRVDKSFKQNNSKTSSAINKNSNTNDKDDILKNKPQDSEFDDDDSKSDSLCSGGLKVPPLKIVIPQQNCAIDSDCNGSRTGKLNTTRNPALPYVVASNTDSNDRDVSTTNTSPRDSPIKLNHTCASGDEKNSKLNEEKNLRVLRSAHRVGLSATDRNSNNSSPQIPSNSPSPASSNANDIVDNKTIQYSNNNGSPIHQNISFDHDNILNLPSPSTSSTSSSKEASASNVELHPRKRKIRSKTEEVKTNTGNNEIVLCSDTHPHDLPFTNCFQMYMNIRRQIEKKWKNAFLVKPRPPQGFNEYLLNTKNYMLQSKQNVESPDLPRNISSQMKDIYLIQQKDRLELYYRHIVEREKLCLNVEQEILRIHTKAARNMACQLLPFSACSYMKDDEVYNMLTHDQEDKEKNARYRYNGRLLLSWLQDVDDKWEKIKESMVLRHHNEAESLHAVQLMDWELALKKYELIDLERQHKIDSEHVPIVHVNDDFDLLPA
ncbi:uncharacterized protein LOC133323240 [Musca vetustissima]|uniref:uncharacterized protein LOC133323240 n=1 Tax=Musca vetustissima TaxID=27455 RepID=UPI002AB6019C|nr:uncharacterized protein LOC133323240 [Musca vetustissima]